MPKKQIAESAQAVLNLYREHGHVNRELVAQKLALSKLQAGRVMRDFLHVHAPKVHWDQSKSGYLMRHHHV
jgi:hypothetical protein